ncbi:5-oxoprolinase subunit B family protein [Nocardioides panzhihuensis]|uniref:Urea carboxylase n=1 Tax=Nocardioides panzhihuensis TaxID=860243 RepID=A0A7Z0DIC4_9ACTN|nr:carboxyltransferase domain-containing protein [Nocardioides panzhihuensis]NYI75841.1 urea carboxylase [Nocardioides panzhihuensis]
MTHARGGSPAYTTFPDGSRASFGGDEYIFVELDEAMSIAAALRAQSITVRITDLELPGVLDIAPANSSYLIRVDPEAIDPRRALTTIADVHAAGQTAAATISTEILDVPVLYDDPWSTEVCMRFRDGHQSATETDLQFTARINGFVSVDELVEAHSSAPFIVTFPCFKPGNAESYQLVPRERQIQAPKYLTPRTETPARAVAHGGAFTVIYPSSGVGGYQLLGRSAIPVVDLSQTTREFRRSPVLTPISTLLQFRPVDRAEYDEVRRLVDADQYAVRRAPVEFSLSDFDEDPVGYARSLKELLS